MSPQYFKVPNVSPLPLVLLDCCEVGNFECILIGNRFDFDAITVSGIP